MAPQAGRKVNSDHSERVPSPEEEEDSPLDRKQTIAIWYATLTLCLHETVVRHTEVVLHICRLNQLAQGVYITLPYTLAVYMVRHFEGSSGNEESIGRNTGLLVRVGGHTVLVSFCLNYCFYDWAL